MVLSAINSDHSNALEPVAGEQVQHGVNAKTLTVCQPLSESETLHALLFWTALSRQYVANIPKTGTSSTPSAPRNFVGVAISWVPAGWWEQGHFDFARQTWTCGSNHQNAHCMVRCQYGLIVYISHLLSNTPFF